MSALKILYRYCFHYPWLSLAVVICLLLQSLLTNLQPWLIGQVTGFLEKASYDQAWLYFSYFLIVLIASTVIGALRMYFADRVFFPVVADIRQAVFEHLHRLDFAYHTKKSSGSLISLFKRGEGATYSVLYNGHIFTLQNILDFLVMLVLMAGLYPRILLVTLVVILLNSIVMVWAVRKNVQRRQEVNELEDEVTRITVDNMVAFDTVKHFAKEDFETKRLQENLQELILRLLRYGNSFRIVDIFNGGILYLGIAAVIGVGLYDLERGQINLTTFVTISGFATLFFPRLLGVVFQFRDLSISATDFKRYLEVLTQPIELVDNPKPSAVLKWGQQLKQKQLGILYDQVIFSYDHDDQAVIDNIYLEIAAGQSVAFVGRSGAGKSTLVKLLQRFYDVSQGQIKIGDVNIAHIEKSRLRKAIGIVPQEALLFNDTLLYNVTYGRLEATPTQVQDALEKAYLWDFVQSLPKGLQTMVGERGIRLSGGQKQRLAIARAFLEDAPIIVFDEATSSLDSQSEKHIQEAFWRLSQDKTTIIIAHRLSTIQRVDRIIVFDQGKIIEDGTHQELTQKKSSLYRKLWQLQTSGQL